MAPADRYQIALAAFGCLAMTSCGNTTRPPKAAEGTQSPRHCEGAKRPKQSGAGYSLARHCEGAKPAAPLHPGQHGAAVRPGRREGLSSRAQRGISSLNRSVALQNAEPECLPIMLEPGLPQVSQADPIAPPPPTIGSASMLTAAPELQPPATGKVLRRWAPSTVQLRPPPPEL